CPRCTRATPCAPWRRWRSDRATLPCRHLRHVQPGRRDASGRQQRVGARRRRAVHRLRRAARCGDRRGARRGPGVRGHPAHPRPLAQAVAARILLTPADLEVWQLTHGDLPWDDDVTDGDMFTIAGVDLEAMHTPGHSPGSTCYYCEELGAVFTGDTLFQGGP